MPKGDLIDRNLFNSLHNQANTVMGLGSGNNGYGQAVSSAPVVAGTVITAGLFNNIRSDLSRAWVHQRGTAVVNSETVGAPNLKLATAGTVVGDYFAQYQAFITGANGLNTALLSLAGSDSTSGVTITNTTRSTAWGGAIDVISQTVTVTFNGYTSPTAGQGALVVPAADHARVFFNAGGSIQIAASLDNSLTTKNATWQSMLSSVGALNFRAASTDRSGGSTLNAGFTLSSASGFRNLTIGGAALTMLIQPGPAGVYAENDYIVQVSRPTANTLSFVITFRDDDAGDQTGVGPGEDEEVTGNLNVLVSCTRPSGSNVDIPAPSGTATAIA